MRIETTEWIPLAEAARMLGITRQGVMRHIESNRLRSLAPWDRQRIVHRGDVERMVAERTAA